MNGRDNKVYEEATALWRQVIGEPPPAGADAAAMLDLILGRLPESRYERLADPRLRPFNIAFPKQPAG